MKTTTNQPILNSTDEFTNLYNWSERATFLFQQGKANRQSHLLDGVIDLMCMAAIVVSMINCL